MKLHELGAQRPTEQLAKVLESQAGISIDFGAIGPRRAQGMLNRVREALNEHRTTTRWHNSETDPAYLQLLIMEQGLESRLAEQDPAMTGTNTTGVANPAQAAAKMKMAAQERKKQLQAAIKAKQDEVRELQKQLSAPPSPVTAMEGRRLNESELQQAQVVLAAQDMVDRVQKMMEDISEMQFKDLPALVASIKNDLGTEQATQFQSAASAALNTLLQSVQGSKTELESAQGVLTGQEPVVPGADAGVDASADIMPAADGGEELDLDLDANLPADDEDEEEAGVDLGRERR